MSKYWQHENPIECPEGHKMIWLGLIYWICPTCKKKTIWVEKMKENEPKMRPTNSSRPPHPLNRRNGRHKSG